MWVHENCGGKVTWEDFDEEPCQICECGKTENDEDFHLILVTSESARQNYILSLERDKFEQKICDWVIENYHRDLQI